MTTTDKSRADALTDEQREAIKFAASWFDQSVLPDTPYSGYAAALRALLAASPVEQHEAAPADEPTIPADLHHDTAKLVRRFARALANKLLSAQRKYGYSDNWMRDDWADECRAELMRHVQKGDPRDVAAYCAFLWHHNESTKPAQADAQMKITMTVDDAMRIVMANWGDKEAIERIFRANLTLPRSSAEVTDDKAAGLIKTLSDIIHDQTVAMQSAIIEWQHGKGAEAGLSWIVNTLEGPGHLPDFDAPHGKHAQFWFNANQANPLPTCFCGNPSSSLWMGQGFCCDEHYREAKAKHDAARAGGQ
ncbi:hypothetical protein [Burkholderia vietnamiensis]|uniref:hypothetical protein n=1 Tax=Burkholderia vietnamiensis TaxID=60552 RepID=UPI00264A9C01|nr:hypothetical protein [Burkholderia vietnamiensis]MDN7814630.1 hypothetical protein [Burkholderia vietnamiensis]